MISVCIGAKPGPLLRRTLLSFDAQTYRDFEVVVAWDGPARWAPPAVRYPLTFVATAGGPLPMRNHARNAAAASARGEFLWFVDQDFLWDPWTLEHLAAAGHAPITPVLVDIRGTPEWWEKQPDTVDLATLTTQGTFWSGFARRYRPGGQVVVEEHDIPEGYPLIRTADFPGFDERFVGYGGNKEALVKGLRDYRLLASARGYHQPHHRAPQPDELSAKNKAMYDALPGRECV